MVCRTRDWPRVGRMMGGKRAFVIRPEITYIARSTVLETRFYS